MSPPVAVPSTVALTKFYSVSPCGGSNSDIGSKSWPFDIRLRPWAFRPGIGLPPIGFCCATSPVVAGAIRTRKWPLSKVFVGFNRQYVRSAHYGEVCDFFAWKRSIQDAPTTQFPGRFCFSCHDSIITVL